MQSPTSKFYTLNKTVLMTLAMIFVCLFLYLIFPSGSDFRDLTKAVFFFILLPILYIRLILRKSLGHFGFIPRKIRRATFWMATGLIVSLIAGYLLLKIPSFEKNYILPEYVMANFWLFIVYELVFVNVLYLVQEAFFRGFVQFSLSPLFGAWAVLIQAVIFFLTLLATRSLSWQIAPEIVLSLTGGIVALKSRSWLYSWIMALIFSIVFNSFIIYTLR